MNQSWKSDIWSNREKPLCLFFLYHCFMASLPYCFALFCSYVRQRKVKKNLTPIRTRKSNNSYYLGRAMNPIPGCTILICVDCIQERNQCSSASFVQLPVAGRQICGFMFKNFIPVTSPYSVRCAINHFQTGNYNKFSVQCNNL